MQMAQPGHVMQLRSLRVSWTRTGARHPDARLRRRLRRPELRRCRRPAINIPRD